MLAYQNVTPGYHILIHSVDFRKTKMNSIVSIIYEYTCTHIKTALRSLYGLVRIIFKHIQQKLCCLKLGMQHVATGIQQVNLF